MSRERVESVVQAAILRGLLPPTARAPGLDARPWPIVLLTGLGAWLAALPLLGVVGMLFQGVLSKSVSLYGVGVLLIAVAMVVLRSRGVPLFVEQIAIPALLVGAGALGGGLFQDWSVQTGAAILVVVAVGIAIGVPQAWLRVLLGAAAAGMFAIACMPEHGDAFLGRQSTRFWIVWHLNLAIGLGLGGIQRSLLNDGARAGLAAALESLAAGWLVATLVGLSWWSGMTFLAGSTMGGGLAGDIARELSARAPSDSAPKLLAGGSLICAIGAALWMGYGWHSLRRPANAGVALVLAALAWFMPALGGALLILAGCATSARWRLAASAGLAAAWIVGAFYYQLQWPLVNKALVLLASGALIGALA